MREDQQSREEVRLSQIHGLHLYCALMCNIWCSIWMQSLNSVNKNIMIWTISKIEVILIVYVQSKPGRLNTGSVKQNCLYLHFAFLVLYKLSWDRQYNLYFKLFASPYSLFACIFTPYGSNCHHSLLTQTDSLCCQLTSNRVFHASWTWDNMLVSMCTY